MQQNASPQENNSKRQPRTDSRENLSAQQSGYNSSHSVPKYSENHSQSSPGSQRGNNSSFHETASQSFSQDDSQEEKEGIDLQSLAQSFGGDDIKAAKTGGEILDACFHDKEKSLILILILLLSSDNADTGLLLALMYLLI